MVRLSKWIKRTKPEHPITKVARLAFRERQKAVWYYARLAAKRWKDDIEYVHQLRVATRRARAALQIFADLVPKREARRMNKRLRELRQAAGNARDLDVLGKRLGQIAEQKEGSHLGPIVEQIAARRRKAQKPLANTYKKAKRKRFKGRSRALLRAVQWQRQEREATLAEAAQATLAPLVDEFFTASRADLSGIEVLHQMRISGKQVRYAMELLAGAFDESFRRNLYATVEEVQEKLGTINDHATAITMFNGWFERADYNGSRAELGELIAQEEKQLNAKCQEFRDSWTAERSTELGQHFATVLRIATSPTRGASWRLRSPTLNG